MMTAQEQVERLNAESEVLLKELLDTLKKLSPHGRLWTLKELLRLAKKADQEESHS